MKHSRVFAFELALSNKLSYIKEYKQLCAKFVYGCTLPADKSYSLTAPPLLPLNSNSSHGSKHTLSIAVLLPVKLQMWLARPSFQTLTRLSSPPVASTAPECGPIATQLTFVE
eukprot:2242-Heterococcus_DN1.PRE.3